MVKTAVITGASSGFGLLTCVTLAKRGWRVLATMRDLSRRDKLESAARNAGVLDRIEYHALDVTNAQQIAAIADLVSSRPEPLHALVNNAGFALSGFAEEVTDGELRSQFETNFFGTAAVTRALLPKMRKQGFGHIVMLSSISGRVGFPGISSYVASKFALDGWTESLRYEMGTRGIRIVLIEPGKFETDIWTRNAQISDGMKDPDSPNVARVAHFQSGIKRDLGKRPDPQAVADLIARVLENPRPKLRYVIGTDAHKALLARKILPEKLWERIIVKVSGMDK